MYVADSEPDYMAEGRGRAVVTRRVLISGELNHCEVGRDTGRLVCLTSEALLYWDWMLPTIL